MGKKSKPGKSRIKNREVNIMMFPRSEDDRPNSPLEEFPEHAQLISYIIAEWSQIEHKLAIWLGLRLSADNQIIAPMVFALETSRARLDLIAAGLRHLMPPSARNKLDAVLLKAQQALAL